MLPLVRRVMPEASITDEAKACFDKLLVKGGNYVVVLNPDQTIAGIVTRSSMARLWPPQSGGINL